MQSRIGGPGARENRLGTGYLAVRHDEHVTAVLVEKTYRCHKPLSQFGAAPSIDSSQELLRLTPILQTARHELCLEDLHLVVEGNQSLDSKVRVIVLTGSEDKNEFVRAMKLGCCGIVLKQTAPELIVRSIRKVNSGEIWLDSHTTAAVMCQSASPSDMPAVGGASKGRERSPLSKREREIVGLVAQGYKNRELAERLFISEQTVKNHLHNIFDKVGVSDRLELALFKVASWAKPDCFPS